MTTIFPINTTPLTKEQGGQAELLDFLVHTGMRQDGMPFGIEDMMKELSAEVGEHYASPPSRMVYSAYTTRVGSGGLYSGQDKLCVGLADLPVDRVQDLNIRLREDFGDEFSDHSSGPSMIRRGQDTAVLVPVGPNLRGLVWCPLALLSKAKSILKAWAEENARPMPADSQEAFSIEAEEIVWFKNQFWSPILTSINCKHSKSAIAGMMILHGIRPLSLSGGEVLLVPSRFVEQLDSWARTVLYQGSVNREICMEKA